MEEFENRYINMSSLDVDDTSKNNVKEWHYTNSKCCQRCIASGPVSVDELHQLWIANKIQDTTKVYSHVTAYPVEINEIWKRDLSTNTVEIRHDSFKIGDLIQYKPWIASPSPNSSWLYVTKHQKGIIYDIEHCSDGRFYLHVKFDTKSELFIHEVHEIFNVTIKEKNNKGIKKCCSMMKIPITYINQWY
eukprot:143947_1